MLETIAGSFTLRWNDELGLLSMPALSQIAGYVEVKENPKLPQCYVTPIVAAAEPDKIQTNSGNCGGCPCP